MARHLPRNPCQSMSGTVVPLVNTKRVSCQQQGEWERALALSRSYQELDEKSIKFSARVDDDSSKNRDVPLAVPWETVAAHGIRLCLGGLGRRCRSRCHSHRHPCGEECECFYVIIHGTELTNAARHVQHRCSSVIHAAISGGQACQPPCEDHGSPSLGVLDVRHDGFVVDLATATRPSTPDPGKGTAVILTCKSSSNRIADPSQNPWKPGTR